MLLSQGGTLRMLSIPRLFHHFVQVVWTLLALVENTARFGLLCLRPSAALAAENLHIPSDLVVECGTAHRKPPEVRICRLRNQSRVGTVPPSTSTPHWPAC